eukprot:TRINITY_DN17525_c0_g1_i1.p1 TRINITY_DN17525_c0_g1~~TRINITY_DN17525_c0_g1_i1.p1  ORF type:complete len:50 (-),score=3.07 TRINITY_DN17525_c0_g1_i1:141-290(-)
MNALYFHFRVSDDKKSRKRQSFENAEPSFTVVEVVITNVYHSTEVTIIF